MNLYDDGNTTESIPTYVAIAVYVGHCTACYNMQLHNSTQQTYSY